MPYLMLNLLDEFSISPSNINKHILCILFTGLNYSSGRNDRPPVDPISQGVG